MSDSNSPPRELPISKEQLAELTRLGTVATQAVAAHQLAIRMVMAGHGLLDVRPIGVGGTPEAPTLLVP